METMQIREAKASFSALVAAAPLSIGDAQPGQLPARLARAAANRARHHAVAGY